MKLLVIGATGPTGRELVRQGLAAGHEITALVRDAARAGFPPAVRLAVGNILDATAVNAALAGQDAVVCSLGSGVSGPFKEVTVFSAGTRHVVEAMQAAGVRRLVCITGVGAGDSRGHGPWFYNWLIQPLLLRGIYQDKTRQEAIVRASGLDWTLVRPGMLADGPGLGLASVRAVTDLAGVHAGNIRRADVAAFCLRELADPRHRHQSPVITS